MVACNLQELPSVLGVQKVETAGVFSRPFFASSVIGFCRGRRRQASRKVRTYLCITYYTYIKKVRTVCMYLSHRVRTVTSSIR
jgi:hypothetical protein